MFNMKHNFKQYDALADNKQRGGALLVALILIFMLSVMGVSSMRGSTLEKRMATNSIQTATTFQAAESMNEIAINNTANLTAALNRANVQRVREGYLDEANKLPVEYDLQQAIDVSNEATVEYVGVGPAPGFSFPAFVAYRYSIESAASVEAVRSSGQVTQGAYRVAPGL